jgi:hypothetical protein
MNDQMVEELEELLVKLTPHADREFFLALRQDVLQRSAGVAASDRKRVLRLSRVRVWRVAAALVMIAILVVVLIPAGRTFAQEVLRLGVFFVTQNLTAAERWLSEPPAEGEIFYLESRLAALEEASQLAGFPVYYPAYLPDGYKPDSESHVDVIYKSQGEVKSVDATFTSKDGRYLLASSQVPFPPDAELSDFPLDIGDAQAEPASVRGNEALWLADYVWGTVKDAQGVIQPVRYNVLLWTLPAPDGAKFYFWLGSEEKLPQAEMIRIAESMVVE